MRFKPLLRLLCYMNPGVILLEYESRLVVFDKAFLKHLDVTIRAVSLLFSLRVPLHDHQLRPATTPDRSPNYLRYRLPMNLKIH
jgi:hypothetical protein